MLSKFFYDNGTISSDRVNSVFDLDNIPRDTKLLNIWGSICYLIHHHKNGISQYPIYGIYPILLDSKILNVRIFYVIDTLEHMNRLNNFMPVYKERKVLI